MRVIGDVHGKFDPYIELTKEVQCSLQIGDMGFNYEKLDCLSQDHSFFGGNHDNYDIYYNSNTLGDFGYRTSPDGLDFFYVRGAFSIDMAYRKNHAIATGRISWWKDEELSIAMLEKALREYKTWKPRVMFTHDCPESISHKIGNPDVLRDFGFDPDTFRTNTQLALQAMYQAHQPKLWVFGHYHKPWVYEENGTTFVCIDELDFIDIEGDEVFNSKGERIAVLS